MEYIEEKQELAWIEEEKNEREVASFESGDTSSALSMSLSKSPRRKMKRQQLGKEENSRKEISASTDNHEDSTLQMNTADMEGNTEGCRTPPNPVRPQVLTTPPLPPGRRWSLQFNSRSSNLRRQSQNNRSSQNNRPGRGLQHSSRNNASVHENSDFLSWLVVLFLV